MDGMVTPSRKRVLSTLALLLLSLILLVPHSFPAIVFHDKIMAHSFFQQISVSCVLCQDLRKALQIQRYFIFGDLAGI